MSKASFTEGKKVLIVLITAIVIVISATHIAEAASVSMSVNDGAGNTIDGSGYTTFKSSGSVSTGSFGPKAATTAVYSSKTVSSGYYISWAKSTHKATFGSGTTIAYSYGS